MLYAVLGVVILSVCPSVTRVLCDSLNKPTGDIFIPHERAILLVKCDVSYSCAEADKISTELRARAVSLRQLSYLFQFYRQIQNLILREIHCVTELAQVRENMPCVGPGCK